MPIRDDILIGDCRELLNKLPENYISACITDPPYNYEFIGHNWDNEEIERRTNKVRDSNTLVKNIPYGSGLAGGVRNKRWYEKVQANILDYQNWCYEWSVPLFRTMKPGGIVAVFNSTRTVAHVQIALERAGFYTRDCIVYRRHSGIPKGLNVKEKLKKMGDPGYEIWEGWHSCLRNEWEAIILVQKPLENNYIETLQKYGIGLFYTKSEDDSFQSNIIEGVLRNRNEEFNIHCTVKPLALMKKLIRMFVPLKREHIVLDPFAGSGTTLVAAANLGVSYIGIEIVPEYIEIIRKRLKNSERAAAKRRDERPDGTGTSNVEHRNVRLFD
ncbi:MAG: DNA-methyltransferase [Aggregatilineales bacterium]